MFNMGKDLPLRTLEVGDLPSTEYQLRIGDEYVVYSISIWNGAIYYLTKDKYMTLPSWYPADLFTVIDNLLPLEWYFSYHGFKENWKLNAIWGYKEIALDEKHYEGLIEREDTAIRIFLKRKQEIEELYE